MLFNLGINWLQSKKTKTMSIPKTMAAVAVERTASGPKLQLHDTLVPHPGPGQILIKVATAGVNRADLLQAQGHHPPPAGAPDTPGLECAGTVVAVAQAVTGIREGDRVCALLSGGGYAEYAVASALCTLPVPSPRCEPKMFAFDRLVVVRIVSNSRWGWPKYRNRFAGIRPVPNLDSQSPGDWR